MPINLGWDDLLIQRFCKSDVRTWLGFWSGTIRGTVAPLFMSQFGDWFLRRSDGATDELSIVDGAYTTQASTPEEFTGLINSPAWQEEHLHSLEVLQLHVNGMIPLPGQCYAFATPPVGSHRMNLDRVILMEIGVWQNICARHCAGKMAPAEAAPAPAANPYRATIRMDGAGNSTAAGTSSRVRTPGP